MAKKEFKIGEIFQCGLVKLKCKNEKKCSDCFFHSFCTIDVDKITGCCSHTERDDKTDVIFVKVED